MLHAEETEKNMKTQGQRQKGVQREKESGWEVLEAESNSLGGPQH